MSHHALVQTFVANTGSVFAFVHEYLLDFVTTAISALVVGRVIFYRSWREWKQARFEARVNISLNTVVDGTLHIRTILEAEVEDVFLSPYARRLVNKAAKKTTEDEPLLQFRNPQDSWMVYNEVLNRVSGIYGSHFLTAAIKQSIRPEERFLMAISWERAGDIRVQKLRILLVQKPALDELAFRHSPKGSVEVEVPVHKTRIGTLLKVHERILADRWPDYQSIALPYE